MTSADADVSRSASAGRQHHNRRLKVNLSDDEAASLRRVAVAAHTKPAQLMHRAILSAIAVADAQREAGVSPASAGVVTPVKKKGVFTEAEARALHRAARAAGLLQQDYIRHATVAAITQSATPKAKATIARNKMAAEISALAFALNRLGNNVNQLARQANTGLVPLTPAEIKTLNDEYRRLMALAANAMEKVLA